MNELLFYPCVFGNESYIVPEKSVLRDFSLQNVRMSNLMGRELRIFGQKAFCSVRGHSRVLGKRQSVSRRVFFPFFVSPLCRIVRTDADRM